MTALRYLSAMCHRGRCLLIAARGDALGWCTVFLARSVPEAQAFHARGLWTTPPDAPTGDVLYLDKLVTQGWSKGQRAAIVAAIRTSFPTVRVVVWYRPTAGDDRCVIKELPQWR